MLSYDRKVLHNLVLLANSMLHIIVFAITNTEMITIRKIMITINLSTIHTSLIAVSMAAEV